MPLWGCHIFCRPLTGLNLHGQRLNGECLLAVTEIAHSGPCCQALLAIHLYCMLNGCCGGSVRLLNALTFAFC